jgi:hypothetical protein
MEEIILNGNALFFRGQQIGSLTIPEGTLKEGVKASLRGEHVLEIEYEKGHDAGYYKGYEDGLAEGQSDVA